MSPSLKRSVHMFGETPVELNLTDSDASFARLLLLNHNEISILIFFPRLAMPNIIFNQYIGTFPRWGFVRFVQTKYGCFEMLMITLLFEVTDDKMSLGIKAENRRTMWFVCVPQGFKWYIMCFIKGLTGRFLGQEPVSTTTGYHCHCPCLEILPHRTIQKQILVIFTE